MINFTNLVQQRSYIANEMDPTPTSYFLSEYLNSYIVTDNPTLVKTQLHQHVYTFNNTLPRASVLVSRIVAALI